jgi:CHAT domain-containing protein
VTINAWLAALPADETRPHYTHPAFWAPFVVIGEGGA